MDYKEKYESLLRDIDIAIAGQKEGETKIVLQNLKERNTESEDEMIKEDIISLVNEFWERIGSINPEYSSRSEMLAWLEKQGEQKYHLELKAGHWYFCHQAYCERADIITVKEGEVFQCEKDGIVKGLIIKEPEKYFKEISTPSDKEFRELRELREIEQKPAEWSEKDEQMINDIIEAIDTPYSDQELEMVTWLKSLKPQPNWKPSKVQLEVFFKATTVNLMPDELSVYHSLYNDLKKL